jgi:hypothetical protein
MIFSRLFYVVTFITLPFFAQQGETPKKEFDLRATPGILEVSRGSSATIVLGIARSKSYQRSDALLSVGSSLPQGLALVYEKSPGTVAETHVTINVSDQVATGDFNLVLNCTINYKTKGVVVRINIR